MKKKRAISIGIGIITTCIGILHLSVPDVSNLRYENPETTAFIELRRAEAKKRNQAFNFRWTWTKLDEVPLHLIEVVVESEDPDFWEHPGISLKKVKAAFLVNISKKKFEAGGSTITQQVAKNLYLSPSKDIVRKVREWFIAWELERHLTKERILEIYLNIAEWGDGVFGAGAASQYRFNKHVGDLELEEAIELVSILPYPLK